MSPEVREAIRIADKHLLGESAERRSALATEISEAICRHAFSIAGELIADATSKLKQRS